MRNFFRKSMMVCMTIALLLSLFTGSGFASTADSTSAGNMMVTGYTISKNGSAVTGTIVKGTTVDITVHMKYTGSVTDATALDVSRLVDSFSGGTIEKSSTTPTAGSSGDKPEFDVTVKGLTYTGSGRSLKLMTGVDGNYEELDISIAQCKEYEEPVYETPTTSTPEAAPTPMVVISRDSLSSSIKAKEERTITVHVKNVGQTTIKSPVITFTPSDSLILPGTSSSIPMNSISPGKTESVQIQVKAMDKITSASQYLDAELKFQYYNNIATVDGSGNGRISIPAKETKEKEKEEEETPTDSPVPNIIISNFSYGGSSVAAGADFNLSFGFKNTSSSLKIENVVVTVEGGEGFQLSGSTNTFYFEKIGAGKSKTITVPMKALTTVQNGSQPVSVNFKYEYVDNKKRIQTTTDGKISVPTYQPDRFQISLPKVPVMAYTGEETTVSLDYVNKGRDSVLNVSASLEGDVDTLTPNQNIGNLEAGKSGTITFAVTPLVAGDNEFTITVTYEDANGEEKSRIFPVTLSAEEISYDDTGWDEPMEEAVPETKSLDWKWIAIAVVATLAILVVVMKKRKKAKAAKKEAELWANWDDDMTGSTGSGSSDSGSTGSAGTASGQGEQK